MRRRILGGTGISVSEYCFGTMMLGAWGTADHDEAVRIVHAALDAGINFVDTADMYSDGESEIIVGKALKGRRDDIVLASKVHFPMGEDDNRRGNSRRWITRAVEDSLRRLDTDYLDLYQLHRPDPATDVEESLSVLSDLVRAGKVRAIGSSVFPAEHIVEAQWTAQRWGHVRLRTEQPPYSILNRAAEAAVLPTAHRYGMGVLTWSPLASGWLSGRYERAADVDLTEGRRTVQRHKFDPALPANACKLEAVGELRKLAADIGRPLTHVALAFVRAHPAVTSAIIGPRTMAQLTDLVAGSDLVLEADVLDRIDRIVPPGTDLNPLDADYLPPSIAESALRRR
ncbi:aldo/keto reductase [Prauserella marina]|uniref:Predicted oxidoreductase n=1 Tax=Prauserella marina TaxID=530584 RepID=A0A222VVQ5_9PSEU|nr:aldo/keto reductase [Prauserella marina]ASR37984.1 aldo/keto reductase [Prauserella marina]PWV73211.1 aryl-alcohol dehydrogenase-like predicted oxidoreductase [Prauserella marina]SDD69238.1 Predicted oxidoreductase [Prauserella marina]